MKPGTAVPEATLDEAKIDGDETEFDTVEIAAAVAVVTSAQEEATVAAPPVKAESVLERQGTLPTAQPVDVTNDPTRASVHTGIRRVPVYIWRIASVLLIGLLLVGALILTGPVGEAAIADEIETPTATQTGRLRHRQTGQLRHQLGQNLQ